MGILISQVDERLPGAGAILNVVDDDHDGQVEISDIQALPLEIHSSILSQLQSLISPDHSFQSSGIFRSDLIDLLSAILQLPSSQVKDNLRIVPNGSAYSGDSSDKNVQAFQEPPVEELEDSAPVVYHGFFGISPRQVGLHGFDSTRPFSVIDHLEGGKTYERVLLESRYFLQKQKHIRSESPHQIWATSGMGSLDSDLTKQKRKKLRSIAQPFSRPLGPDLSQFGNCYRTLLLDNQAGFKDLIFVDNVGNNDVLSWGRLIVSHQTTPEEFGQSLEYRFKVLQGLSPLRETGEQQKIEGLLVIRFGILPLDKVMLGIEAGAEMGRKKGPGESVPDGSQAFLPVIARAQKEMILNPTDVLTPEELVQFRDYIASLREIERKECEKHGVVLIRIDDYINIILDRLIKSGRYRLDQLIWHDGYHPREPLKLLLVLARALESRDYLVFNPSDETLELYEHVLGISRADIHEMFQADDPQQAFSRIVDKIDKDFPKPTEASLERAAVLFPEKLYPILRRKRWRR